MVYKYSMFLAQCMAEAWELKKEGKREKNRFNGISIFVSYSMSMPLM